MLRDTLVQSCWRRYFLTCKKSASWLTQLRLGKVHEFYSVAQIVKKKASSYRKCVVWKHIKLYLAELTV